MSKIDAAHLGHYLKQYDYTAYLSNRDWAYEYQRRNPEFQKLAWDNQQNFPNRQTGCYDITLLRMSERQPAAERWGLKFFPNPDLAAPKAPVFWTAEADPGIIKVTVVPRDIGEPHDLFEKTIKKCKMIHLTDDRGEEHLVHVGPGSSVQVRCIGHTLVTSKPVKTFFSVGVVDNLEARQDLVRRATDVYGDHYTVPPTFTNAARLLRNGLIALDCKRAGLSDREVACIIEGPQLVESGVTNGDRSLINRVKYYRDRAMELCDGGFRRLLFPAGSRTGCT